MSLVLVELVLISPWGSSEQRALSVVPSARPDELRCQHDTSTTPPRHFNDEVRCPHGEGSGAERQRREGPRGRSASRGARAMRRRRWRRSAHTFPNQNETPIREAGAYPDSTLGLIEEPAVLPSGALTAA